MGSPARVCQAVPVRVGRRALKVTIPRIPQTRIDETPVKASPPAAAATQAPLRPSCRCAQGARAGVRRRTRRIWTWFRRTRRERSSGSSIDRAMADAEQSGLGLHLRVQLAVLAVVAVWLVAYYAPARSVPGLLVVATLAAFGLARYVLGRRYGRPVFWAGVFSILEAALLIGVILTPITFPPNWPPQMQLRLPTVFYLFVYVAGTALSYSPRFVVWTGAATIALWGLGHQAMLRLPGTVSLAHRHARAQSDRLARALPGSSLRERCGVAHSDGAAGTPHSGVGGCRGALAELVETAGDRSPRASQPRPILLPERRGCARERGRGGHGGETPTGCGTLRRHPRIRASQRIARDRGHDRVVDGVSRARHAHRLRPSWHAREVHRRCRHGDVWHTVSRSQRCRTGTSVRLAVGGRDAPVEPGAGETRLRPGARWHRGALRRSRLGKHRRCPTAG